MATANFRCAHEEVKYIYIFFCHMIGHEISFGAATKLLGQVYSIKPFGPMSSFEGLGMVIALEPTEKQLRNFAEIYPPYIESINKILVCRKMFPGLDKVSKACKKVFVVIFFVRNCAEIWLSM